MRRIFLPLVICVLWLCAGLAVPAIAQESAAPLIDSSPQQAEPYSEPEGPRAHILDDLFLRLKRASSDQNAADVIAAIQHIWMHSGSDSADVLMDRALQDFQNDHADRALIILNRLVWLEPQWAEAWNKRALVRFSMRDDEGALDDLHHVLSLEPRHYGALAGVGFILKRNGHDEKALAALRLSLGLNPHQPEVHVLVDDLQEEVEGRAI